MAKNETIEVGDLVKYTYYSNFHRRSLTRMAIVTDLTYEDYKNNTISKSATGYYTFKIAHVVWLFEPTKRNGSTITLELSMMKKINASLLTKVIKDNIVDKEKVMG